MMFKRMMIVAIVVTCASGLAFAGPGDPSSGLINQYNAALPVGAGSSNITTAGSGTITGCNGGPCLVDGNFVSAEAGTLGAQGAGGVQQANGFYGHTTDPDRSGGSPPNTGHMWVAGPGGTPGDKWVSFSFTDGPHLVDWMQVWNLNEVTPNAGQDQPFQRATKTMNVYWANTGGAAPPVNADGSAGAGWNLAVDNLGLELPGQAGVFPGDHNADTASDSYTGQTVDLSNFTADHILFDISSVYGGDPFASLSEVQFYTVPEPASFTMLLAGMPLMFFLSIWNQRRR